MNITSSPRFKVSLLADGRPPVGPALSADTHAPRARNPAKLVTAGSASVQIFGRAPGPFTIAWRETAGGTRRRAMRSTFAKAKRFAESIATNVANGQTAMNQFTEADRASYRRAIEILGPTGQALETAAAEHARREKLLVDTHITFDRLITHWAETCPRDFTPLPMPDLVEQFLQEKAEEICAEWHTALSQQLHRLAKWTQRPLHTLSAEELTAWLRDLKVGPRTRANYRAGLEQLAQWAKDNQHLPRIWSELDQVKRTKVPQSEIKILTPEDLTKLLYARSEIEEHGRGHSGLLLLLALQAFAGLRHSEARRLDWRDVHLSERHLFVAKDVARKIKRDRLVPISDNLAAWLQASSRPNGLICPMHQTSGALTKAKRSAGLPSGRNESRNILRKSFISYRLALIQNRAQVAEEAGNSPSVIRANYLRPIPESEARRWFNIWPQTSGIIQLKFAGL